MFTSYKSDAAPSSRQPSVDLSATGSLSSTPTSEPWTSQCTNELLYGAMQSPERRPRAYSSKRSSVFNLRSRSNTAASMSSSVLSLSPSGTSYNESRPGTPLALHDEVSGSRKSLFRGKKGKRLSESVSSNMILADLQERDVSDKRMSVLRRVKRRNNQDDDQPAGLKHRISSPFGFQHLTHTDRQPFSIFEQTSGDKLASGFRTVQTSQKSSQDAPSVMVDELHFSNFSSDNLATEEHQSFIQSPELQQSGTTVQEQHGRQALRLTRSVESFSQPGINSRSHRHSQSVLVPPRLSSLPLAPIDDVPEEVHHHHHDLKIGSTRSRSKRESGIWDSFSLATAAAESHFPGIKHESVYVGHALTTPDDTAIPAMPASFSPSLDDVTEEPEYFSRPRPAPQPPMRTPGTPQSPQFDSTIFSNPLSPVGRLRNRGLSNASPRSHNQRSPRSRPVSQCSDTLGSTDLVRRTSIRKPSSKRRQSNTWRAPEASWEDDIDYIYEHALEADCDFEWDCASDGEVDERQCPPHDQSSSFRGAQHPLLTLQPAFEPTTQYQPRDFRVSLLVPSVPDLIPTFATSVSTPGTGLMTPCDSFRGHAVDDVGGLMVSPSLLVPQEYKDDQDQMYDELLDAYDDSERHYPMLDPRYSGTSSARSRRSSYDSSLMSSAQSSGMWSSPVRRSASSTGSIPDLVPSRRSRRDHSFSLAVDQLADSFVSLSHLDEEKEDEDVTPPGRALENRTLFPVEDEPEEPVQTRAAIENELRASLELARRGSQRSTQAPTRHHKQARSNGAAKLLMTASGPSDDRSTKSHSRAATTQNARSPILSLFPAPPRRSPNLY